MKKEMKTYKDEIKKNLKITGILINNISSRRKNEIKKKYLRT